jgi:DNA-binding transcriptional LysR family regulator
MPKQYQSGMELRQLRYFIAVAEIEHFRRAAQSLGIAQPALSRQITALESELGISLFERLPRGVKLSEAGRVMLFEAKRTLAEIGDATERVRRVAHGQVGRLRIGFSEAASGHAALTETIRSFRAAQPDVELSLVPMPSGPQVEALRHGAIDAGFQYRMEVNDIDFDRREMAMENVMLALPHGHPLTTRRVLRLADLREAPLICIARHINPDFHDAVMAAFLGGGLVPRIVQEASSTIVLSLVSVGMGLGLVSTALQWRAPQDVVFRSVQGLSLPSPFDLVWRRDNKSPVLQRFVENAMAVARAEKQKAKRAKR